MPRARLRSTPSGVALGIAPPQGRGEAAPAASVGKARVRGRSLPALALLALAACAASEPSTPPPATLPKGHVKTKPAEPPPPEPEPAEGEPSPPTQAGPPPLDEATLRQRLAAQAVVNAPDSKLPRTLYTWTTREQIEALAASRKLLQKSRAAGGELSRFDALLKSLGDKVPPTARLLREAGCAKKRFAWPNPWATVLGFAGEQYGDQLVEITLKDDSILVLVESEGPRFRYLTLDGGELNEAEAKAARKRIAGALHVSAPAPTRALSTLDLEVGWPLREFVICNEGQVAGWAYGTPAILTRMGDDVALLRGFARLLEGAPAPAIGSPWDYGQRLFREVWPRSRAAGDFADDFGAALAWATSDYLPRVADLQAIASALLVARDAQLGEIVYPAPPPGGSGRR